MSRIPWGLPCKTADKDMQASVKLIASTYRTTRERPHKSDLRLNRTPRVCQWIVQANAAVEKARLASELQITVYQLWVWSNALNRSNFSTVSWRIAVMSLIHAMRMIYTPPGAFCSWVCGSVFQFLIDRLNLAIIEQKKVDESSSSSRWTVMDGTCVSWWPC